MARAASTLRQARTERARRGVPDTATPRPTASRYNASGTATRRAIERVLIAQGRTWTSVARAAGVAEGWLYMLPRAGTPSVWAIQAVASVLAIPPWELLWPAESATEADPTAPQP